MELFVIYLWLKLNAIGFSFVAVCIASLCAMLIGGLWLTIEEPTYRVHSGGSWMDHQHTWWSFGPTKFASVALLVFFPSAVLLPSSKDAAILFGAHYAIKAAESPEGAKVMGLLRKRVNEYLDEAIAEPPKEKK